MNEMLWCVFREDCLNGIIKGISFKGDLSIRYLMGKYRSGKKCSFDSLKGISTFIVEIPFVALVSKASKRNDYIGVVVDKATIEIGEAKIFLNVVDFPKFGPILYCLNFGWIHRKAFR